MVYTDIKKLLLIGIDTSALARSANKAGYEIYLVDYFGDMDLRSISKKQISVIKQQKNQSCGRLSTGFDPKKTLNIAKMISKKNHIDGILLSTGLDDSYRVLCELSEVAPILGNSSESIQRVRNKEELVKELKLLGVLTPETAVINEISDGLRASKDIGYPIIVKPMKSFGGFGIRKIENRQELEKMLSLLFSCEREVAIQEFVSGIAASASVISSISKSVTLTVNEQLIGLSSFGQMEPFGYCGNILPLSLSEGVLSTCAEISNKVVTHFKLVGSNGVDFVISQDGLPHVVEVNPRFQGTLECVETLLGINLVEAHIKAFTREQIPIVPSEITESCSRVILYALYRSVVPDLRVHTEVRDIPLPGVIVEKGEPVCSIISVGKDRETTFRKAEDSAKKIFSSLNPVASSHYLHVH